MSRKIAPLIDIVRLEDKETKLRAFIRTVVEQAELRSDPVDATAGVMLVARSVESPVAKAVAALVREGAIRNPIDVVLAIAPRPDADAAQLETLSTLSAQRGARVIRDARLFDAHEQIVLGAAASWIGDCMRRDPMKRDAYECFAADCAKTAGWALTSHQRMRAISEPMADVVAHHAGDCVAIEEACVSLAGQEQDAEADPMRSR